MPNGSTTSLYLSWSWVGTTATISGLTAGTTYAVCVFPVNTAGNDIIASECISASTDPIALVPGPGYAPSWGSCTRNGTTVTLRWNACSIQTPTPDYQVGVWTNGQWVYVDVGNVLTYTFYNVPANQDYFVRNFLTGLQLGNTNAIAI
jgi:hypothetical protein